MLDNERLVGTSQYKTVQELAIEFEVTPLVVYQLRHRLKLGLDRKNPKEPRTTTPLSTSASPSVDSTAALLKVLEDEPLLGPADRLRILSRLIRTGAPAIKIQAIKTYEDLTRVTVEKVGPPDPLTEDEAVARLARLMLGLGEPIVSKAREVAFGSQEESPPGEPEAPLQPDPVPVSGDGGQPEREVPHLPEGEASSS